MKTIFYISDEGLSGYNDENTSIKTLNWEDDDAIDSYLANIPDSSEVYVVLDVIEEDIHFEWAPKVMSWEKQSIKERRIERIQGEDIALAEVRWTNMNQISQDGRKEVLMLFSTINDSVYIQRFLERIEEAQLLLQGIYSKPFLLETYLKKRVKPFLALTKQQVNLPFLMVTRQSEHAFRQTFFIDGVLRISRLVEIDKRYKTDVEIRRALVSETKLAITYIYSQKLIKLNSEIGLAFLDGNEKVLEGLEAQCKEEGLIRSSWEADRYFFAASTFKNISPIGLHCNSSKLACFSPQAIIDFLFNNKLQTFYHTAYVHKITTLTTARKVFIGLNIVMLIGGLYYILISGIDTLLSWQKQEILQQKIIQHNQEITRLESRVKLQDDAQQIKASVEFSESILKLKLGRLISFDMSELSEVFARNPNIQLSNINWKTIDRFDSRRNQIEIKAWVSPFYGTYKNPVIWVDQFVADLNTLSGIESVLLQKEPLNRQLNQSLSINSKMMDVQALPFTVTVRVHDVAVQ